MAEHRWGTFILGTAVGQPEWAFVPDAGSRVRSLKAEYADFSDDYMVYNRFDTIEAFWKKRLAKHGGKVVVIPQAPGPPAGGVPAGWRLRLYTDADRPKAQTVRVIHHLYEPGTVRPTGDFVPDYTKPVGKRQDLPAAPPPRTGPEAYTLPADGRKAEPTYEYRSGRLIKGTLHDTGSFAPEVGSTVLAFRDFDPVADRRRIYNLPGVLVPADAPAPGK